MFFKAYHSINDSSKHYMLPIEPTRSCHRNEELGTISIWARVSHANPSNTIVFEFKVFIRKSISIDAHSWETKYEN